MFKKIIIALALTINMSYGAVAQESVPQLKRFIKSEIRRIVSMEKYDTPSKKNAEEIKKNLETYMKYLTINDLVEYFKVSVHGVAKDNVLGVEVIYQFVADDELTTFTLYQRNI